MDEAQRNQMKLRRSFRSLRERLNIMKKEYDRLLASTMRKTASNEGKLK